MHTKSHPQNSGISQAVVNGRVRPSTLPRHPWCQGYGNVMGRWCLFTTAHDMGRRLSNASPTPWSRVKSQVFFLAGTGIPEYSGDSGVIRRNTPPAKRRFLWKNFSGKNKNPKESGGILAGMKSRVLEMDIPETGKCNLGCVGQWWYDSIDEQQKMRHGASLSHPLFVESCRRWGSFFGNKRLLQQSSYYIEISNKGVFCDYPR